jgi:hypothetical protein
MLSACSLLLLFASASCVVSPNSGQGGTTTANAANNPVVMNVNGRDVHADELLESGVMRDNLRDFIAVAHIRKQAAEDGVKISAEDLQKKITEQKEQVATMGQQWDNFLFTHGMTEETLHDQMEFSMILEAMATKKVTLSDDELKKIYDASTESIREQYKTSNYLTDEQAKTITFDKVKEWLRKEQIEQRKMGKMQDLYYDALRNVKVKFPSVDAKTEEELIGLIIKSKLPDDKQIPVPPGQKPTPDQGQATPDKDVPDEGTGGQANGAPQAPPTGGGTPPPPPGGGQ